MGARLPVESARPPFTGYQVRSDETRAGTNKAAAAPGPGDPTGAGATLFPSGTEWSGVLPRWRVAGRVQRHRGNAVGLTVGRIAAAVDVNGRDGGGDALLELHDLEPSS